MLVKATNFLNQNWTYMKMDLGNGVGMVGSIDFQVPPDLVDAFVFH
jgi:hypothetical protein